MNRTTDITAAQAKEAHLRTLFLRGLDGDGAAYRQFLAELGAHLRGFLRRRLHDGASDIEDLVQEILLAIHNGRHTYRAEEPLTAWIHAIARYKLTDYFRGRARHDALND